MPNWEDQTEIINGYTIYPKPLTEAYRNDTYNYERALKAVIYFESEMQDDLLVQEIKRIGASEEFFNHTSPDDFYYKIDISKGNDYQLKSAICVSLLTLNSHAVIINYYRRYVTDNGEPVLQKYIGPITQHEKVMGSRTNYTYTTESVFRLHAFLFLKFKHNYSATTILNILGYVVGDTTIIDRPNRDKKTVSSNNDNKRPTLNDKPAVDFADLKVELLKTNFAVKNLYRFVGGFAQNIERDSLTRERNNAILSVEREIKLLDDITQKVNVSHELALDRKTDILNKMNELTNLYTQLEKEIGQFEQNEEEIEISLKQAQRQLEQLKDEVAEQKELEGNAKLMQQQLQQPVKRSFLSRIFGGGNQSDMTIQPPVETSNPSNPAGEIKALKTAQNVILEQIESFETSLRRIRRSIEKKQLQLTNIGSFELPKIQMESNANIELIKKINIELDSIEQQKLKLKEKLIELNDEQIKLNYSEQLLDHLESEQSDFEKLIANVDLKITDAINQDSTINENHPKTTPENINLMSIDSEPII